MAPPVVLFHQWYEHVSSQLMVSGTLDQVAEEFVKHPTDEARAQYAFSLEGVIDALELPDLPNGKSNDVSVTLRGEGNKFFQGGSYNEALKLYNESVSHAIIGEKHVAAEGLEGKEEEQNHYVLALGNRSATLLYLQQYDLCLKDISEALRHGYPINLCYKLYERKAKALAAKSCHKEAVSAYEKAIKKLDQCTLTAKKKEKLKREMTAAMRECKTANVNGNPERRARSARRGSVKPGEIPPLTPTRHKVFTSLSSKCDVKFTESQGRFIVARQEILPGEVVLVEKPYASILLPDQYSSHCHLCMKPYLASIPCIYCPTARYCSADCRHQAWDLFHKHECACLPLIHQSGLGKFGHLAVRTLTRSGAGALLEYRKKCASGGSPPDQLSEGLSEHGLYEHDSYNAIHNLVTHAQERAPNDLFRRTLMALFLTRCLQHSGFFRGLELKESVEDMSPASVAEGMEKMDLSTVEMEPSLDVLGYFAGLLLSHLQALPCNAHEISELELDPKSVATSVPSEIGAGIYSTLSLFNHSCDPAVNRNFYGDICVVRAIKLIRPGEEVSDNYGAVYAVQCKEERQEKLSPQYFFSCACQPCCEDWPLYPDIPSVSPQWKCPSCLHVAAADTSTPPSHCSNCNSELRLSAMAQRLKKMCASYESSFDRLLACQVDQAMPGFVKYIEFLDRHVKLPWQAYNNCQETLKQCYSILGNCRIMKN